MKRQRRDTGHIGLVMSAWGLLFSELLLSCPPPPCPPCYSGLNCTTFCHGLVGDACCQNECCMGVCCGVNNECCRSRICCNGKCCPYGRCCANKCCYNGPYCCGETCCQRPEYCCNGRCCNAAEPCCGDTVCCAADKCCGRTCCDRNKEEECCDELTCYRPDIPWEEQCCHDGQGTICPKNTECCLDGTCATECELQEDTATCSGETQRCPTCGYVCEEHYTITYTGNSIYSCMEPGCPGDCQDDDEVICSIITRCQQYMIADQYCDHYFTKDCLPAPGTSGCARCQKSTSFEPQEVKVPSKKCGP